MTNKFVTIPLYHTVKESYFFSFEEVVEKRREYLAMPIPPNEKEFKISILSFYTRIRPKIYKGVKKKTLKQFQDIVNELDSVINIEQLPIKKCLILVNRFSDLLDALGVTSISFKKISEEDIFDYRE